MIHATKFLPKGSNFCHFPSFMVTIMRKISFPVGQNFDPNLIPVEHTYPKKFKAPSSPQIIKWYALVQLNFK